MDAVNSGEPSLTFLIGGLGAGKTELAINLALLQAARLGEGRVDLLDLDIVNPFFRVRKVKDDLQKQGINVVTPDARVVNGDLPALPGRVWTALENPERSIVCDIGGGELGLRPLARLKEFVLRRETSVYFVINPFRPGFQSPSDMEKNFRHMESISALSVTHLVANPHLLGETTPDLFQKGVERVEALSRVVGLPIVFCMATSKLREALPPKLRDTTLAIRRYWEIPWVFGTEEKETPEKTHQHGTVRGFHGQWTMNENGSVE